MKKHRVFEMLGTFSKGVRGMFALAVITAGLSIVLSFLTPQIIRFTVDSVVGDEASQLPGIASRVIDALGGRGALRSHLFYCALGVAACAALSALMNHFSRVSIAKGTEGLIRSLRHCPARGLLLNAQGTPGPRFGSVRAKSCNLPCATMLISLHAISQVLRFGLG